nr:HEAT repeat domain-containing protein [Parachlamydia sp. AcF125]
MSLSHLFLPLTSYAQTESAHKKQVLYFMQRGNTQQALNLYSNLCAQTGKHDFELLEQVGLILLDQGLRTRDPETQLLTMFGAGIAANDKTLYVLEEGLKSPNPMLQLISLNLLANSFDDEADEALMHAMLSSELLIRLEAAFQLAKKKHPQAVSQIESLMYKVPNTLQLLFPQLFALVGSSEAFQMIRKLMTSPDRETRLSAIQCVAKAGRDDFLPQIRVLASHHDAHQQEICAYVLGLLKDEQAAPLLEKLSQSGAIFIRLAALNALYELGHQEACEGIIKAAKNHNPYALTLLGNIKGYGSTLYELSKSGSPVVKLNACLSLLRQRDRRCLPFLADILLQDSRDLAFVKTHSPGLSLSYWKIVPSAHHNLANHPIAYELSIAMREQVLIETLELPENDFLEIAAWIFEKEQNDLIPCLVNLLENLQTPKAIEILKKYQQKAGAPLIRNYCNLVLYKLKIDGPYEENLKKWILEQKGKELIRFRPFLPWETRSDIPSSRYHLTPHETSRLLIDSFEALARSQNNEGIQVLLEAIQNGNPSNKYALAGLLLRSIQ